MAKKLTDLLLTLRAIEESVGTRGPRMAAERIVEELQERSPAWTGTFRNSWRIAPGDQDVPVSVLAPTGYKKGDPRPDPIKPAKQTVPPLSVGTRFRAVASKNKTLYTIGNASEHRLIAMDLVPGRNPAIKPPRNWFTTYMDGGAFERAISVEMSKAIREATR